MRLADFILQHMEEILVRVGRNLPAGFPMLVL